MAPLETTEPSVSTAPFIADPAPNVTVVPSAILGERVCEARYISSCRGSMVISRAWHAKPLSSVKSKSAFLTVAHPNGTFPNTAPCPASGGASAASEGEDGPSVSNTSGGTSAPA
jgi:hypothetical protein